MEEEEEARGESRVFQKDAGKLRDAIDGFVERDGESEEEEEEIGEAEEVGNGVGNGHLGRV